MTSFGIKTADDSEGSAEIVRVEALECNPM